MVFTAITLSFITLFVNTPSYIDGELLFNKEAINWLTPHHAHECRPPHWLPRAALWACAAGGEAGSEAMSAARIQGLLLLK